MVSQPHLLMPRPLSLAVLGALLTFGLWLFVPWGRIHSSFSSSGGSDNSVAAAPTLKTDGPWAPHWYGAVERSTGFGPPETGRVDLPDEARRLADLCRPYYGQLAAHRL